MLAAMKRTLAIPPILIGLLATVALSAVPASGSTSPCGPAHAHTLAASRVARIYVVHDTAFGCSVHGSRSYTLGQRRTCLAGACVQKPSVAGELAAYGLESCGIDTCSAQVVVRRLSDGVTLHTFAEVSGRGVESFPSLGSMVLKRDGAVAWIGVGHSIGPPHGTNEVHRANAHGAPQLIDSGSSIAAGALRLHGSTLSWRHGSRTVTATLS
jgi:hypothetical protein